VHITFYTVTKKVTAPMVINASKPFEEMTPDELNEVFREVKKLRRDQPYKLPGIRIAGYIPPDWAEHLDMAVDYAWQKGMIKHKTVFSFTTWCVKQVISSILLEIRRERTNPPLKDNLN
jgi:hypothetical protein